MLAFFEVILGIFGLYFVTFCLYGVVIVWLRLAREIPLWAAWLGCIGGFSIGRAVADPGFWLEYFHIEPVVGGFAGIALVAGFYTFVRWRGWM